MDETGNQTKIERAAEILAQRPYCAALTGAGLSTRSGLPDFRSPGKGLWVQMEKMPPGTAELMTLQGFKENPEAFYRHFRPYLEMILSAKPNPAHTALAELEAGGYLQAILTMNGDMLHQKAGSRKGAMLLAGASRTRLRDLMEAQGNLVCQPNIHHVTRYYLFPWQFPLSNIYITFLRWDSNNLRLCLR